VKNAQLFQCPDLVFTGSAWCAGWALWADNLNLPCSYGWNCQGLGNGWGTQMGKVIQPADLMWIADGGNPWRPWKRPLPLGCGAGYTSDDTEPHNQGRNVAYCDGHVKWMKSSKLYADTQGDMQTYLPWANASATKPGW